MAWRRSRPRGHQPIPGFAKLNVEVQIAHICAKAKHATNEEAQSELARLLERGEQLEYYNLYQCTICDGAWHVGHREPSREKVPLRPPSRPRFRDTLPQT
jgi:hypothetical protein